MCLTSREDVYDQEVEYFGSKGGLEVGSVVLQRRAICSANMGPWGQGRVFGVYLKNYK